MGWATRGTVRPKSCDQGSATEDANTLPEQALLLPLVRAMMAAEVLNGGGTTAVAECVANSYRRRPVG